MTAVPANTAPPKVRKKRRVVQRLIVGLLLVLASLTVPQVFRVTVLGLVEFSAWRRGATVRVERVEGSLWEPVVLLHSYWSFEGASGAVTRLEIARAEALISWKNFFARGDAPWFQRLAISGVQGKTQIPLDRPPMHEAHEKGSWFAGILPHAGPAPLPETIEATEVDYVFQSNDDYVRIEEAHFTASAVESGELRIGAVTFEQPWLRRTFHKVRGKAALQDSQIALANVTFEPGVELQSLTSDLGGLLRGQLDLEADFALFGGKLRVEAATKPAGRGVVFESGGTFEQINIAKLANFLALSDAAGGVIKNGNFKFRGPPRDLARAQASLRFDAVNFQWESRQWDSLTLGVTLLDRRVQVPQLDLRQGKNELHLSGELVLPGPEQKWWEGDFTTNVDAKIENLTELSALVLPEFTYAAGRAQVEGSIRGHAGAFNGQLLVEGSRITWRNAPIETLHAAVKLSGNEIQVANVELVQGDDFLRGRGLVKLSKPPVYWGELRLSVQDLANYAAFLQKPVLPEPLAGGAVIDWTGEGSKEGHSGKFSARLRMVRSLGAMAQQLHPINADIEASYQQDAMQFTRFSLNDGDSSFTANVAVGGKALHLQQVQFIHRGAVQLEGDALLPLDVWQSWPNVTLTKLLNDEVVSRVQLTAKQLDLAEFSSLTGWKFPLAGTVDGSLSADGTIKAPVLGGQITLANGRIPIGWTGDIVTGAAGKITFKENTAVIEAFRGQHSTGPVEVTGSVQLADLRDPTLALTLKSPEASVTLFGLAGVTVRAGLETTIAGPWSAAKVTGSAKLAGVQLLDSPDLVAIWKGTKRVDVPAPFTSLPWVAWTYDIACTTDAPMPLTRTRAFSVGRLPGSLSGPTMDVNARLAGKGGNPRLAGKIGLHDYPFGEMNPHVTMVADLLAEFPENVEGVPSLTVEVEGDLDGTAFSAHAFGPPGHLVHIYEGPAPLNDALVRDLIVENKILVGPTAFWESESPIELRLESVPESVFLD